MKRFMGLFVVLMVLAACAQLAPEAPLEPSQAAPNAPFVIDFNNLKTGQLVWTVLPGRGMTGAATDIGKVKIVARRDNNKARRLNGNRAMVFDAACKGSRNRCTGNTSSLYHPEQGKVAIISENNNSVNPKPNKWGGIIDFKFDQFAQGRADLKSIKVFGVERKGGHIDLYRDRQRVARIPIPVTGASGSATVTLDTVNIGLMRVRLVGSAAVDDVMLESHNDDGSDGGDGDTTLPPDPGEAGKATLAGIDRDNDGVRDDVERYIALTYPNDEPTVGILTDYAKLLQQSILETHSETELIELENQALQLSFCLAQWRPTTFSDDNTNLHTIFFNTPARFDAEMQYKVSIPTSVYEVDDTLLQNCSQTVRARSVTPSLSPSQVAGANEVIFFINGVWNDLAPARDSQIALHDETGRRVALLHNQSQGKFKDVIEAIAQQYAQPVQNYRQWLSRAFTLPGLANSFISLLATTQTNNITESDLTIFLNKYKQYRDANFKIVFVAHSQGNFFANTLYDRATRDAQAPLAGGEICGLDIVGVATPATRTLGSGFYETSPYDLIIKYLPSAQKPTNANSERYRNVREKFSGHEFLETYLYGDILGEKIHGHINSAFTNMVYPQDCAADEYLVKFTYTFSTEVTEQYPASSITICGENDPGVYIPTTISETSHYTSWDTYLAKPVSVNGKLTRFEVLLRSRGNGGFSYERQREDNDSFGSGTLTETANGGYDNEESEIVWTTVDICDSHVTTDTFSNIIGYDLPIERSSLPLDSDRLYINSLSGSVLINNDFCIGELLPIEEGNTKVTCLEQAQITWESVPISP